MVMKFVKFRDKVGLRSQNYQSFIIPRELMITFIVCSFLGCRIKKKSSWTIIQSMTVASAHLDTVSKREKSLGRFLKKLALNFLIF